MAKELTSLAWVEDLLPADHLRKRMFGGFAYYLEEKLVLVVFESEGNREHRGRKYPFEIWNGCMFPVEKEFHSAVSKQFSFLIPHPVLPKWFYLPMETEDFESLVQDLFREIRRRNPLFGSLPKPKSKTRSSKKSARVAVGDPDEEEILDTRRPRMFSDDIEETRPDQAKKISDLKNLGPESEKMFHRARIKTAQQLIKMGWKKSMTELCKVDPKNNHSIFAYAVIGALQNKLWHAISEEEKKEAREFMKSLRVTQKKKK